MEDVFKVGDLLLAAFLQSYGHRIQSTHLDERGLAVFVFSDSNSIRDDSKAFLEDGAVGVRTLSRNISKLRRSFREMKRRGSMKETMNGQGNREAWAR